jgi:beta-phosphoglucomutase
MSKKAVIFDLDGVIVSTDVYHYLAWKKICDQEGLFFTREINEKLRGVSRMESLNIILGNSERIYAEQGKVELAERKNAVYKELLKSLCPDDILPGVRSFLQKLKELNVRMAIGSSSKNAKYILEKIGLDSDFDAVADGNGIERSKPDPEVFLLAAKLLQMEPNECVVVEDAEAGIDAALAAGMKAIGVGSAALYPKAQIRVADLVCIDIHKVLED